MDNVERKNLRGVWREMFLRCYTPWHPSFFGYGARGITVSEQWRDFDTFLSNMGDRPKGFSLERVDNNKGYSPENCRWATPREQAMNRRPTRGKIEMDGEIVSFVEAAKRVGIKESTIRARVRLGWDLSDAITIAPSFKHRHGKVWKVVGDKHPATKIPDSELPSIIARRKNGEMLHVIAADYGVCAGTISLIARGIRKCA
jgi:hypothetical protein